MFPILWYYLIFTLNLSWSSHNNSDGYSGLTMLKAEKLHYISWKFHHSFTQDLQSCATFWLPLGFSCYKIIFILMNVAWTQHKCIFHSGECSLADPCYERSWLLTVVWACLLKLSQITVAVSDCTIPPCSVKKHFHWPRHFQTTEIQVGTELNAERRSPAVRQ